MKKVIKYYLNSDKESNYEYGRELGMTDEALEKFIYTCYEIGFTLEVDVATGEADIIEVENIKIEKPVRVS